MNHDEPSPTSSSASYQNMDDLDGQIAKLRRCELINEADVRKLCVKAREILVEEGNVQWVDAPVTIVGDIHGQFYDLKQLFQCGGDVPERNYLFLGDFVDRGYYSVETFLLLLALKVRAFRIRKFFLELSTTLSLCCHIGSISGSDNAHSRQSRVASDNASVWLLRRMLAQIRLDQCVALLHRHFRLSQLGSHRRRSNILRSRRPIAVAADARSDTRNRSQAGGAARGSNVRSAVVGSGRASGDVGNIAARRGLSIRIRAGRAVSKAQQRRHHLPSASARHGGLQVAL